MPREPKVRHVYSVYLTCYGTAEIKERVEQGELSLTDPMQLTSESFYFGTNERTAGVKFYQACKVAMGNPLAVSVTVIRDSQTVVRVPFRRTKE